MLPYHSSRTCILYKNAKSINNSVFCDAGREWEKSNLVLSHKYSGSMDMRTPTMLNDEEATKRTYVRTGSNVLLASGAEAGTIDIYDMKQLGIFEDIYAGPDLDYGAQLAMSGHTNLILQINIDGTFAIFRRSDGARVLRGVSLDSEYVVYNEDGYYDSSPEGAQFVYRYFPGMQQHFAFAQFDSVYHRPDLIRAIARGEMVPPPPAPILAPPVVSFKLDPDAGKAGSFTAHGNVTSTADLRTLRVFVDGAPVDELSLSGRQAPIERSIQVPDGKHFVTLAAYDSQGFSSVPSSVDVPAVTGGREKGRLFYVGVAVDQYQSAPEKSLKYATSDMQLISETLQRGASG